MGIQLEARDLGSLARERMQAMGRSQEGMRGVMSAGRWATTVTGAVCVATACALGGCHWSRAPQFAGKRGMAARLAAAQSEGERLSPEDVAQLERQVNRRPSDILARVQLLSYYFFRRFDDEQAAQAHLRHVTWMVTHHPESEACSLLVMKVNGASFREAHKQIKEQWLRQVADHPDDPGVVANAALFMASCADPDTWRDLYRRAHELDPKNPRWPLKLGQDRALRVAWNAPGTPARRDAACEALGFFAEALPNEDRVGRHELLADMAEMALECGRIQESQQYAERVLKKTGDDALDPLLASGDDTPHRALQVLGRIALKKGSASLADEFLLESARTPASPTMTTFGPEFDLARELVERGERDAVIQYLELCRSFWDKKGPILDRWEAEIRAGRTPEFRL